MSADDRDAELIRLRTELAKWTTMAHDEDHPLPEDKAIDAAHPLETDRHDLYMEAMRFVGAKHSKHGLVNVVNWLLLRIECWKALHGRKLIYSQRQMMERGDLKACEDAGQKSESFVEQLQQKREVMRLTLKSGKVIVTLFLPVRDGHRFDAPRLHGDWPPARATWDGNHYGAVSWDEELSGLFIEWSDGDLTRTEIRSGLELYPGRKLFFSTRTSSRSVELTVESVELL